VVRGLADNGWPTVNAAAWSPDGQRLAYTYPRPPWIIDEDGVLYDQSYETTLHFVNADGTGDVAYLEPHPAQFPPGQRTMYEPAWSAQGALTYLQADDCSDCAGGQWYELSREDGSQSGAFDYYVDGHHLDWAPGGLSFIYEKAHWPQSIMTRADLTAIAHSGFNPITEQPLGVTGSYPVWSAEGREYAFIGSDGIYVADAFDATVPPRRVIAVTGVQGIDW
jgi:WD40 repeat protein